MNRSRLLGALCSCLVIVPINAKTAIISDDWKTPGDNLITRDTDTGFEWLDLTATVNMSYNDVSAQFSTGGFLLKFKGSNGTHSRRIPSETSLNNFLQVVGTLYLISAF